MPPSSRDRMLDAAVDLLQRRGFHGTGLNELLARSGTPRGSLYFHFPGGKEQIGAEAIARAGEQVASAIAHLMRTSRSPADAVQELGGALAAGLEASEFERGCPVATTALEAAPGHETIRAAVQASFESWLAPLGERLEAAGLSPDEAAQRAELVIGALEGALILARARRDGDVVRRVARQLRPVVEARGASG